MCYHFISLLCVEPFVFVSQQDKKRNVQSTLSKIGTGNMCLSEGNVHLRGAKTQNRGQLEASVLVRCPFYRGVI